MSQPDSPIIGIDLGTTNSVVALFLDGKVRVLQEDGEAILPSVVGLTTDGKLVVGEAAKNQLAVFPDRTIASVKRQMGKAIQLQLGDQNFTPQEISAAILSRLRQRAEQIVGTEVTRAVITVPAFFDEHQRQATREAGQLAGLTVERIINEPTAASLVYHAGSHDRHHLIVYDFGGGTFDVSIVRMEDGVVEVLSSKGDTQLGGDDFDQLLAKHVADQFLSEHDYDLMSDPATRWRLMQACERAKCELSSLAVARISEEFIATIHGRPVNLDVEVTRHAYEELIAPLVDRTIQCVDEAIRDSRLLITQLDELVLVGGSTRTPLIQERLRAEFQREPKWAVNPDLAVALGAATQGAMQSGHSIGPVLIDVASHTLGIEAMSGWPYAPQLRFAPIIRRNSPLPAKYEDTFYTMSSEQREADIHVFQGESSELRHNRSIGRFRLDGLNEVEGADGEILVRFQLTLDGTLDVTAIERQSGRSKSLKIDNALSRMGQQYVGDRASRLQDLFNASDEFDSNVVDAGEGVDHRAFSGTPSMAATSAGTAVQPQSRLEGLMEKARSMSGELGDEDRTDVDRLIGLIETAQASGDQEQLAALETELDDLIFYLAG